MTYRLACENNYHWLFYHHESKSFVPVVILKKLISKICQNSLETQVPEVFSP